MNHLIAKTRGIGRGNAGGYFRVMSTDAELFDFPADLDTALVYNSSYKLEEEEWFKIETFSTTPYFIDLLTPPFASVDYAQIPVAGYPRIDFLCAYSSEAGTYSLQRLSPGQKILHKRFITCTPEPQLRPNDPIIVLDPIPDAIYVRESDTLYFKDLSVITPVFAGIDTLYREATDAETAEFFNLDFIQAAPEYPTAKVNKPNRKRIAMAMEKLNSYSPEDRQSVCGYIREYSGNLPYDEATGQFTISNDEELKHLLFGVDQRFYTTQWGGERRLANSVKVI